jgi:hypothetical protein
MMNEIIIANPIYDVVFKRLMEDTKNARFFIKTLLDQEVGEVQFKPQEYILTKDQEKRLSGMAMPMPRAMAMMRLDFVATIKNTDGTRQKVLIEVQKGKKTLDVMRFREYLGEHYKRADEITLPDGTSETKPLHIITIYIVAFNLPHIETPAVKIGREYIDLLTKQKISAKEDFVEQLTHDCIIVQTGRIQGSIRTELDALLSLFEQRYFVDDKGYLKQYSLPLQSQSTGLRRLTRTLAGIGASTEGRREMEAEEAVRRLVEGDFNPMVQKIRRKLKKVLAESQKTLAEKDHILAEKDHALTENQKVIAELAREIAELKAKFNSE